MCVSTYLGAMQLCTAKKAITVKNLLLMHEHAYRTNKRTKFTNTCGGIVSLPYIATYISNSKSHSSVDSIKQLSFFYLRSPHRKDMYFPTKPS